MGAGPYGLPSDALNGPRCQSRPNHRIMSTMFRCPDCRAPLTLAPGEEACKACGRSIVRFGRVPVLLKAASEVARVVEEASSSERGHWYRESHHDQWEGPYRHHLLKRRAYLESVFRDVQKQTACETLLELGCGDGEDFDWLSSFFPKIVGIDYNALRLERAATRGIACQVALGDALDLPLFDESMDMVYMNHVLEHIERDTLAMKEVFRVLKVGGTLVLGVPNEGALFWQLAYRLQPHTRRTTDHVQFYKPTDLQRKAESVGFDVIGLQRIGWGVPHWSLDARLRARAWVDDAFEAVGRRLIPNQATSLYLIGRRS